MTVLFCSIISVSSECQQTRARRSSVRDKERGLCGGGNVAPASLARVRQNNYLSFRRAGNPFLAFPWSWREGKEEETTVILQL